MWKEHEISQISELESVATKTILSCYGASVPSTPWEHKSKGKNMEFRYNLKLIFQSSSKILLIRDYLKKGLKRYVHLWDKYFAPLDSLNFGIGVIPSRLSFGNSSRGAKMKNLLKPYQTPLQ